jgi:hypothetical protein
MWKELFMVIGLGANVPVGPGPYTDAQMAEDRLAHDAVRVSFAHGDYRLDDEARATLQALVKGAASVGRLHVTHVAAWGDESFEALEERGFPPDQLELAVKRAAVIEAYLTDTLGVHVVTSYDLASDSSPLDEAFATADAELKAVIRGEQHARPDVRAELAKIRDLGGAGSAVVVVEHEKSGGAH